VCEQKLKSKQIKLPPLEGELQQFFVTCGRSDVIPVLANRSATIDTTVKWRLIPRKQIEFSYGGFLWDFLRNSRREQSRFFAVEFGHTNHLLGRSRHFTAMSVMYDVCMYVNSCAPSGHRWKYVTSTACYKKHFEVLVPMVYYVCVLLIFCWINIWNRSHNFCSASVIE
jgi:hypothetical protein